MQEPAKHIILIMLIVPILLGCRKAENERLVEISQHHEARQAEQNQRAAELQREVSAMQREVQSERAEIGRQRDVLEGERRQIAASRRSDSLSAAAINSIGLILACLLPLGLALLLLARPVDPSDNETIVALMVEDLVADQPLLVGRSLKDSDPKQIVSRTSETED